jgi:hypothetical protein
MKCSPCFQNAVYGGIASGAVEQMAGALYATCAVLVIPFLTSLKGAALFADENKDAGGQRHNFDEENGWPERQAEA